MLPTRLCAHLARLSTAERLQQAPELRAAVLRAGAATLCLHPCLIRDALSSPALSTVSTSDAVWPEWLDLLAEHLSQTCDTAQSLALAAGYRLYMSRQGAAAAAAALPPATVYAWLHLTGEATAGVFRKGGESDRLHLRSHHCAHIFGWCLHVLRQVALRPCAGLDAQMHLPQVLRALTFVASLPAVAEQLERSVEQQAALVKLVADGLAAALQHGPRLDDAKWCRMQNSLCMLAAVEHLQAGWEAHEQQSGGALLRLVLQSQEPLAAALAALGSLPGGTGPDTHATMAALAPIFNLGLASNALQITAWGSEPWEQLGPVLPQLLSFVGGLHTLLGLIAEAADLATAEGAAEQPLVSSEWLDASQAERLLADDLHRRQASAASSSVAALLWSDVTTSVAWHRVCGELALAFHMVASCTLPKPGAPSSTLAAATGCIQTLLRLSPLLPRLLVPQPGGSSSSSRTPADLPGAQPLKAGALLLNQLDLHNFHRLSLSSPPHALGAASVELASWLAAACACGLGVSFVADPMAVCDAVTPALHACWAALKHNATQVSAHSLHAAARADASSGGHQASDGRVVK